MQYKLICFDLDGVIFKPTDFWLDVHKALGTLEEGKLLTARYLHSDYEKLVWEVVWKLWKGKDAKPYFGVVNSLEYFDGVAEVFRYSREKGCLTAVITGSSIDAARRVEADFGVDFIFANELVIKNGKITGEFIWPIGHGGNTKAKALMQLCAQLAISPSECIYVGDSENDIAAFKIAGLSIAFNPKSKELESAATYVVNSQTLSDILKPLKSEGF